MAREKDLTYNNGGNLYCQECDNTLEYLTIEDRLALKGRINLFCRRCTVKHFGDVGELRLYAMAIKSGKVQRPEPRRKFEPVESGNNDDRSSNVNPDEPEVPEGSGDPAPEPVVASKKRGRPAGSKKSG